MLERQTDRQAGRQIVAGRGRLPREKKFQHIETCWDCLLWFPIFSLHFQLSHWEIEHIKLKLSTSKLNTYMITCIKHTHTLTLRKYATMSGRVMCAVYLRVCAICLCLCAHLLSSASRSRFGTTNVGAAKRSESFAKRKFIYKHTRRRLYREPWHGTNALIGMKLGIAKFGEAEELIFQNIRLLASPSSPRFPQIPTPPPLLPSCSPDFHSSLSISRSLSPYVNVAQSHSILVASVCVCEGEWVGVCLRSHMKSTYFVQTYKHKHSPCLFNQLRCPKTFYTSSPFKSILIVWYKY